jgi:hypothetical protein
VVLRRLPAGLEMRATPIGEHLAKVRQCQRNARIDTFSGPSLL